ncbi:APC family permease [Pseudonocardia sp. RS010]|uniref:APC family permease n=1 Tax=Pseudonocardia sp. RS010 TaxID=3385979 RepID=UPI0039A0101B
MATSTSTRRHGVGDDTGMRRDLGAVALLFTAIGSVIGSGWLFGALNAAEIAGPASLLSWAIGGVMIILIGFCYAEIGVMFPHSGGVVRFPHYAFGSFASFTTGWITWLAAASVAPIEVEAALQYATNYLPWLTRLGEGATPVLTGPGYAVAAGMMLVFCLINIFGVRWFARVNTAIVWWKLTIILLVVVVLLVMAFDGSHLTAAGGFAPYGGHGVFSAIATGGIAFSYFGFRQGVELAGETRNPRRNIPLTLIGSVVICGIIYVALQLAFLGAVPTESLSQGWSQVGTNFSGDTNVLAQFGPLAAIAGVIGAVWLAVLLYIDAVVSPADTGLIYTTVTSRLSYAMARNGNAPTALSRLNGHGVPWISITLAFVVGLIFFLPFPGWQQLVGFITSATVLSFGSGPLVLVALRSQLPNHPRRFKLRGGPVVPLLAFWSSNLIVYWSGWDTNWKLFVAVLLGLVLYAAHELVGRGSTPPTDFRHGIWVLPWLAGLCLISWLGSFPEVSEGAGNLGVIDFDRGVLWTFVLSVVVMWLAHRSRLPDDRVAHLVEHLEQEDPAAATGA